MGELGLIIIISILLLIAPFISNVFKLPIAVVEILMGAVIGSSGLLHESHLFELLAEVGFLYKKRCWDFGLRYSENRRPVLTTTGDSFIDDKYIYLTLVLKPLMQANDGSLITYQLLQND